MKTETKQKNKQKPRKIKYEWKPETNKWHSIYWGPHFTSVQSQGSLAKCGVSVDWDIRDLNLSFNSDTVLSFSSDTNGMTSLNLEEMGFLMWNMKGLTDLIIQFSKHLLMVCYTQDPSIGHEGGLGENTKIKKWRSAQWSTYPMGKKDRVKHCNRKNKAWSSRSTGEAWGAFEFSSIMKADDHLWLKNILRKGAFWFAIQTL